MSPVRTTLVMAWLALLAGCATWQHPTDLTDETLRARAVTQVTRGVQVSAALLGPDDCRRLLGANLIENDIQPVWIEVRNDTQINLWILRSGPGADNFTPLEAAWSVHVKLGGDTNDRIDEHFERVAMPVSIPAGQSRRGILFLAPQPIHMLLNIDLVGDRTMIPISLRLTVPGQEADTFERKLAPEVRAAGSDYTDLDSLRPALERLPHCAATAEDGSCTQPLNVVAVGSLEDIGSALGRRGFRRDFRESDFTLRVGGEPPDWVARRRAYADASALWIRAWLAPITYQGKPVFVVQVGWPLGGRFRADESNEIRLSGDIDAARDAFIQDSMYSAGLQSVGFLSSTGAVPAPAPGAPASSTAYYTDGHRAVLFFATRPLTVADVRLIDWAPVVEQAEARAASKTHDDGTQDE